MELWPQPWHSVLGLPRYSLLERPARLTWAGAPAMGSVSLILDAPDLMMPLHGVLVPARKCRRGVGFPAVTVRSHRDSVCCQNAFPHPLGGGRQAIAVGYRLELGGIL